MCSVTKRVFINWQCECCSAPWHQTGRLYVQTIITSPDGLHRVERSERCSLVEEWLRSTVCLCSALSPILSGASEHSGSRQCWMREMLISQPHLLHYIICIDMQLNFQHMMSWVALLYVAFISRRVYDQIVIISFRVKHTVSIMTSGNSETHLLSNRKKHYHNKPLYTMCPSGIFIYLFYFNLISGAQWDTKLGLNSSRSKIWSVKSSVLDTAPAMLCFINTL